MIPPLPPHCDFRTPEYATFKEATVRKWEATRGMSHSFGFNRADADADYLSIEALVQGFIDTVSKNGNLLLNVGPRGEDAQMPSEQRARLAGFGRWLGANGAAVYGTRPWTRADAETACGLSVRYTAKAGTVYAHVLGTPAGETLVLKGGDLPSVGATHVASGARIDSRRIAGGLELTLPQPLETAPAHAFALN